MRDNIKIGLKETGLGGVNWIKLAQDTDRWYGNESSVFIKDGECLD
jgi:hypothetical protein